LARSILEYFFHLPTLFTIALLCIVVVWQLYDVGFALGEGYLRVNTNQGNLAIYWMNGCCDLDW
jgi:bacteriorhodopsin